METFLRSILFCFLLLNGKHLRDLLIDSLSVIGILILDIIDADFRFDIRFHSQIFNLSKNNLVQQGSKYTEYN